MKKRRKKSARSEESESRGNLNANDKRRSLARERKVEGISGLKLQDGWQ